MTALACMLWAAGGMLLGLWLGYRLGIAATIRGVASILHEGEVEMIDEGQR